MTTQNYLIEEVKRSITELCRAKGYQHVDFTEDGIVVTQQGKEYTVKVVDTTKSDIRVVRKPEGRR
jgi:uncharacterized membrane protein YjjP (DUF1212 family)